MPSDDVPLRGMFRDVLRDASGRTVWDRGWINNTIVMDCRRLLPAFLKGSPKALGITGLAVGSGDPAWDTALPPVPKEDATMFDGAALIVPVGALSMVFIDAAGAISTPPTRTLQIRATLGPGVPNWPDVKHPTGTIREFGLVSELDNKPILINYRTHVAIAKDKASTLERTIWLVF